MGEQTVGRTDGQTVAHRGWPSDRLTARPPALPWSLLLDPAPRTGADNMALDAALLHRARSGAAFLRLYRWEPACLSFGRNEPALTRYDRHAIERLGMDTVRRPTGGRAVWHDDEVTYAVAAPVAAFGSLRESYRLIHQVIAGALRRLGIAAGLADPAPGSRHPAPSAGACFASPAGGEVVVAGRKLVGSAQVRDGGAFLQHGSVLLSDGQDIVSAVTVGTPALPAATSVSAALGRSVAFAEVARAIGDAAREGWPGDWAPAVLNPEPHRVSGYRDPAWTWRR